MKTVELDIQQTPSFKELKDAFNGIDLQKGDSLHVILGKPVEDEIIILSIALVILYIAQKKYEDYSNDLLDNIFKGKTAEDIERELNDDYNIELVIDSNESGERRQWQQFSQSALVKAYGDEEPEYTEDMVKEPNPEYKTREK
ncbi:MAG TPA: hypothetical protein VHE34_23455 [Puia sp.]|uniref:hypothetical protein n=1 Tax=Puia sp. TaxID=2045100 RepID=UPI002C0DADA1|nr:hypothetical protein [Puia sp.]HVU98208.1 hypothetical protein [Puia sp.]